MKYVCLRTLEQYENLKEYFLVELPKVDSFRRNILPTDRYRYIKDSLNDKMTEGYIAFAAFISQEFESFSIPFQSSEPMTQLLYPEMCKFLIGLLQKFIRKKIISADDSENVSIDVTKKENHKKLQLIEIGTKPQLLLTDSAFFADEKSTSFRASCLSFYVTAVNYLQEHLPFNVLTLKYAQYFHPQKRNNVGATSAVSNLALKFTRVVGNKLDNVFEVNGKNTPETVCDMIRHQWMTYQNEDIPDSYFRLEENTKNTSGRIQYSYWEHALECYHLTTNTTSVSSQYKRVDHYWRNVNNIVDSKGSKKYTVILSWPFILLKPR